MLNVSVSKATYLHVMYGTARFEEQQVYAGTNLLHYEYHYQLGSQPDRYKRVMTSTNLQT